MIEITQLTRCFGSVVALDKLTLIVDSGEILGLVGPNGAGKTTTLRLLATLLRPTSGTATIEGYDIVREPERIRSIVGVVGDNQSLYDRLTIYENLDFFGKMYHVPDQERAERIKELLGTYGLWERRSNRVGTLSKGLRQRIAIVRALIHDPHVLLLDEPTANLDPPTALKTRKLLAQKDGKAIIISTHNLREAEKLCDTIVVMHEGRMVARGGTSELVRKFGSTQVIEIRVKELSPDQRQDIEKALHPSDVGFKENTIVISIKEYNANAPEVIRKIVELGIDVLEAHPARPELEEILVRIIEEA